MSDPLLTFTPPEAIWDKRDALEAAAELAVSAHEGQVDKQGKPYVDHVFRVATNTLIDAPSILHSYFNRSAVQLAYIVALLHDVAEDTEYIIEDIRAVVGDYLEPHELSTVTEALGRLTKSDGERYQDYIEHIAQGSGLPGAIARLVKLSDLADNYGRIDELPADQRPRLIAKYVPALLRLQQTDTSQRVDHNTHAPIH